VQLERLIKWKGEKVLHVCDQRVWEKCKVGASHSQKGWGLVRGTSG